MCKRPMELALSTPQAQSTRAYRLELQGLLRRATPERRWRQPFSIDLFPHRISTK